MAGGHEAAPMETWTAGPLAGPCRPPRRDSCVRPPGTCFTQTGTIHDGGWSRLQMKSCGCRDWDALVWSIRVLTSGDAATAGGNDTLQGFAMQHTRALAPSQGQGGWKRMKARQHPMLKLKGSGDGDFHVRKTTLGSRSSTETETETETQPERKSGVLIGQESMVHGKGVGCAGVNDGGPEVGG